MHKCRSQVHPGDAAGLPGQVVTRPERRARLNQCGSRSMSVPALRREGSGEPMTGPFSCASRSLLIADAQQPPPSEPWQRPSLSLPERSGLSAAPRAAGSRSRSLPSTRRRSSARSSDCRNSPTTDAAERRAPYSPAARRARRGSPRDRGPWGPTGWIFDHRWRRPRRAPRATPSTFWRRSWPG